MPRHMQQVTKVFRRCVFGGTFQKKKNIFVRIVFSEKDSLAEHNCL